MSVYVLKFSEIDKSSAPMTGGKGANLGELSRIDGIRVPDGFCVTTAAYQKIIDQTPDFPSLLQRLSLVKPESRDKIADICGKIRGAIENAPIDNEIAGQVARLISEMGENEAYAVRSSATAEDLPTASFAGQQDTYLNILGKENILKYISKCWASLFTDRAAVYRMQNGFDHSNVRLSVVVQKMVFPDTAGIMFTADPITSNRKTTSIDAGFGLGEALVSGFVDPDTYKVTEDKIINKKIPIKKMAIYALPEGGTRERRLEGNMRERQVLTDLQILELEKIGGRIKAHFGCPQDIEWCCLEDRFYIVQSRPITTLYPIPDVNYEKNHVYMSLSHQQMMTDVMTPLGLSFFPIWLRKLSNDPMVSAGGRMYVDVSFELASPVSSKVFVNAGMGSVDKLIQNALKKVLARKEYLKTLPRGKTGFGLSGGSLGDMLRGFRDALRIEKRNDPALMDRIMTKQDALLKALKEDIKGVSGAELFDFILKDMDESYKSIVLDNYGAGAVPVLVSAWIDKNMKKWLGESGAADTLSQSVANNVTTLMGYALMDLADTVRKYPAVREYIQQAGDRTFISGLSKIKGGKETAAAFTRFLNKYGARCPGEIDIMRPRWADRPSMLVSIIMNNIRNFEPGAGARLFEEKLQRAREKTDDLIARIEQLPGGKAKAEKARKKISVYRNFVGFREYPKYAMMRHFYVYKQALEAEAAKLVKKGVIKNTDDIALLSFEELRDAVTAGKLDYGIIVKRKADQETFKKLTPPRVMTSDGEIINGEYDTGGVPNGALIGVPVSGGAAEGTARVVNKLEDADIREDDILVTAFTDPSWTPLFISISGLVTEVGGMMTHGAVVAREYGLPAVVSVEGATKRIRDGQKIRVNGTKGFVEILD